MASSSSSSCSKPPQDQVFINFRGDELRCSFVSHLRDALKGKEVNVFIDNRQKMGEKIKALLEEIERSKIALAIFSPRYTEAKWCLMELAKMREREEEGKLVVIPIFYKVDPNTVDEQRGTFGGKFRDLVKTHKKEEKEWTEALKYFAKSKGCVFHESSDKTESGFIADIVEHVLDALNNNPSQHASSNPPLLGGTDLSQTVHQKNVEGSFGTELRLKQLEEKLSIGSGVTTCIIGVVGPPGIGKSTLVKKLYEKLNNLYLNIETVEAAHEDYKDQLLENEAFVVLDNVSDKKQIDAILGNCDWIKDGSKIVIATSDKSLIHGFADDIYEVPPLRYQHSLRHFTHYAFGGQSYALNFSKLSKEIVHYSKGNPQELKVLGAELLGKDEGYWSDKLDALRQYHNGRDKSSTKMVAQIASEMLQSVWKASHDALNPQQKDTLLDVACFRSLSDLKEKNRERECIPPVASSSSCSKPPQDQVFINLRGVELRNNFVSHLINNFVHSEKNESGFIAYIVEHVLDALNNNPSQHASSNPPLPEGTDLSQTVHQKNVESSCGIELRLKQLQEKLSIGSGATTCIIGVVGPPGIGKSTLVKKLYEKSNNLFLTHVFIQDVHQITRDDGLLYLLKILLKTLLHVSYLNIETVEAAHEDYKDRLLENKAFVVLDNVSDKKQIDAILGNCDWIKDGSKIVIATSDKSLIHGFVDDIYEVPPLSYQHSLQHFSHYAFGGQSYDSSFLKLSRDFVYYTKGNPLALRLLGAELLGRDEGHWSEKLDALNKYHIGLDRSSKKRLLQTSSEMLQSIWKACYDALNELQKETLLDIACFRSLDENYVASLLDSYGENSTDARTEIEELVHKFLITTSGGKIEMHDTLHMFCLKLGQEASATDGNKQLRLWDHHKILDVLDTTKGASRIRSIVLDLDDVDRRSFEPETFVSMRNMRYIKIYSTRCPQECDRDIILNFPAGLQLPLGELRCLHWLKFPLKELPPDFDPKNLVDLKLPYSKIEKVWKGEKAVPKLKWIDFNHSRHLSTLSGLAEARNLQELNLEGCTALATFPQDMENMKCLVILNLRGCTSLKRLPEIDLLSLKILILSDCSKFKVFHAISDDLKAIYLDGTAIRKLPDAIRKLQRLALLNMKGCEKLETLPDTLGELKSLQELILSGCKKLETLPDSLGELKALQKLLLSGCSELTSFPNNVENMERLEVLLLDETNIKDIPNIPLLRRIRLSRNKRICDLPKHINQFYRLKWLDMKYCKSVTHIPELPPNLWCVDAHGCSSLRTVAQQPLSQAMTTEHIHSTFIFTNCNGLEQGAKKEISSFAQRKCQLLPNALKLCHKDFVPEILFSTCFPGAQIPSWFSHEANGSKVQYEYPQHWSYNKLSGIALCVVISFQTCQDQARSEQEHTNYLSVKFTCKGIAGEEPCGQIAWKVGSWNEQGNKREAIESEHVFIGYTNCVHLINHHEANKPTECAPTVVLLEFSVTDENTSGEAKFEVLKSGVSFVFEPDEKDRWQKGDGDWNCQRLHWKIKNEKLESFIYK